MNPDKTCNFHKKECEKSLHGREGAVAREIKEDLFGNVFTMDWRTAKLVGWARESVNEISLCRKDGAGNSGR